MADVAIVTGCSRGLGRALTERFLQKGWVVYGVARNAPLLTHDNFIFHQCDLSAPHSLPPLAEWLRNLPPEGETVLLNNAGTIHPTTPYVSLEHHALQKLMALNITTPLLLMSLFSKHLPRTRSARAHMVNISSGAGKHPYKSWLPYCSSKAALDMATRTAALEEGEGGITVVSFSPGVMDTPMQSEIRAMDDATFPHLQRFRKLKSEGELTPPEHIAERLITYIEQHLFTQGAIVDYRTLPDPSF